MAKVVDNRSRWTVALDAGLWYLLLIVCLFYPLFIDRAGVMDNENYVDYFINGRDLAWLRLFTESESWLQLFFRLSTEEIVWLLWTSLAGWLFGPNVAVHVTVFLLNLLVVLALRRFPNRSLALALWVVIPVGLAVTGIYQVRQGFAFALWLYIAVHHRRLVVGSVVAALVHTTFSVVAVLSVIAVQSRWSANTRLAALAATGLGLAVTGDMLFEAYGGRRLAESAIQDPDTLALNFLLGLMIVLAFPLYLSVSGKCALLNRDRRRNSMEGYLLLYVGVISFLIFSFFLFPIGNHRLPYLAWLGLIPIIGNFDFARAWQDAATMKRSVIGLGLIFSFLLHQTISAALDNRYACLFEENCSEVLAR
jgi:hypothetical protein